MSIDAKKMVAFQTERTNVNLYKNLFVIVEDIEQSHRDMLNKIVQLVKEEDVVKIHLANYFTEEYYQRLRKKILDAGNEASREHTRTLEQVEVTLKRN